MINELVAVIQNFLEIESRAEALRRKKFEESSQNHQELCVLRSQRDELLNIPHDPILEQQIRVELAKILEETQGVEPFPEEELTIEQEKEIDKEIENIYDEVDKDAEEEKETLKNEIRRLESRKSIG